MLRIALTSSRTNSTPIACPITSTVCTGRRGRYVDLARTRRISCRTHSSTCSSDRGCFATTTGSATCSATPLQQPDGSLAKSPGGVSATSASSVAAGAYRGSELVLRGVGAILSGPVDRVSVASRRPTPCLVGKLRLGLGLAADVLKLVEHPV